MKDIKDYLNLYLGCEVYAPAAYDKEVFLDGVFKDGFWLNSEFYQYDGATAKSLQLILRPLSDMTEEEHQHMMKLHFEADSKLLPWFSDTYFECVRYLLSKHFDLFNLIPEGLAIDKTAIK